MGSHNGDFIRVQGNQRLLSSLSVLPKVQYGAVVEVSACQLPVLQCECTGDMTIHRALLTLSMDRPRRALLCRLVMDPCHGRM